MYNIGDKKNLEISMEIKFLKCKTCGKLIASIVGSSVPTMCCCETMQELVPNTTEAAFEKHIPVIEEKDNTAVITVGQVIHPMEEKHYIEFIAIKTKTGTQTKALLPGEEPKAVFALLPEDKVLTAYSYCNLHGLWASNK